ncbi:hypothetical protein [Rhodococcoides fascians]|uniref:hypothetical protein n=1 Tax=Rhodococcoides fascians TaxID=1828 RepID=UPI00055E895C|nr:hypothetical protein [Rhodococcus fascians]
MTEAMVPSPERSPQRASGRFEVICDESFLVVARHRMKGQIRRLGVVRDAPNFADNDQPDAGDLPELSRPTDPTDLRAKSVTHPVADAEATR